MGPKREATRALAPQASGKTVAAGTATTLPGAGALDASRLRPGSPACRLTPPIPKKRNRRASTKQALPRVGGWASQTFEPKARDDQLRRNVTPPQAKASKFMLASRQDPAQATTPARSPIYFPWRTNSTNALRVNTGAPWLGPKGRGGEEATRALAPQASGKTAVAGTATAWPGAGALGASRLRPGNPTCRLTPPIPKKRNWRASPKQALPQGGWVGLSNIRAESSRRPASQKHYATAS